MVWSVISSGIASCATGIRRALVRPWKLLIATLALLRVLHLVDWHSTVDKWKAECDRVCSMLVPSSRTQCVLKNAAIALLATPGVPGFRLLFIRLPLLLKSVLFTTLGFMFTACAKYCALLRLTRGLPLQLSALVGNPFPFFLVQLAGTYFACVVLLELALRVRQVRLQEWLTATQDYISSLLPPFARIDVPEALAQYVDIFRSCIAGAQWGLLLSHSKHGGSVELNVTLTVGSTLLFVFLATTVPAWLWLIYWGQLSVGSFFGTLLASGRMCFRPLGNPKLYFFAASMLLKSVRWGVEVYPHLYSRDLLRFLGFGGGRGGDEDEEDAWLQLMEDEEEKEKTFRMCPVCRRTVQKIEGCNSMVCGRDYHSGEEIREGCGHAFSYERAPRYKSDLTDHPLYHKYGLPSILCQDSFVFQSQTRVVKSLTWGRGRVARKTQEGVSS